MCTINLQSAARKNLAGRSIARRLPVTSRGRCHDFVLVWEESLEEQEPKDNLIPRKEQKNKKALCKEKWRKTFLFNLCRAGLRTEEVLAEYYSVNGEDNHKSEEKLLSLFNKKISSNPKFRVLKDKVKLVK
ncbi:UNVERIFIED_CONTAM: hypothetical protein FKN15_055297 [Acipenser sinensis]